MATLAADKIRRFENQWAPLYNDIPAIASDIIYQGAAVGESSSTGTARPLVAGDTFLGFADMKADNSSGSAAAIDCHVRQSGAVEIPVTSVAADADLGVLVYASDDDTFTLASTGNTKIGKLIRHVSGTTAIVRFESKLLDLEV